MRFMMHSALTLIGVRPAGLLNQFGKPMSPDDELCQFAAEFNRTPVPLHHVEKAFDEMKAACIKKARDAGLITEDRHARY